MRDDLREKLSVNGAILVSQLDVSGSFLRKLTAKKVITDEHMATIKAEKTQHEKVDQLIDILGRRADSTFDLFCEVVKEVNPDVFKALTGGSGSSDVAAKGGANNYPVIQAQDAPLTRMTESNEELKRKTRKVFATVKASIEPKGHVLDTLFQEEVITPRENRDITNGPDKETRAGLLLDHLFETPHSRAFVVFREALQKDYGWVVEFIDKAQ